MALYGADSEQLRTLSKTVAQAADHLSQVGSQVTSQLGSTRWMGPDGDRFRSQWNSSSMASLRAAAQELHTAAAALQRNAQEQDQASAASGGGSIGAAGIGAAALGDPIPIEDIIDNGVGYADAAKGVIGDTKTLHDAVKDARAVVDAAKATPPGLGSDIAGAAGIALEAKDLQNNWQGIEDGKMGAFAGGLLDVAGITASTVGMVDPATVIPVAGLDLGITGVKTELDNLGLDK